MAVAAAARMRQLIIFTDALSLCQLMLPNPRPHLRTGAALAPRSGGRSGGLLAPQCSGGRSCGLLAPRGHGVVAMQMCAAVVGGKEARTASSSEWK